MTFCNRHKHIANVEGFGGRVFIDRTVFNMDWDTKTNPGTEGEGAGG